VADRGEYRQAARAGAANHRLRWAVNQPAATGFNPNCPSRGHQTYFAATAITTSDTITNAAICTHKLLAKPPLLKI